MSNVHMHVVISTAFKGSIARESARDAAAATLARTIFLSCKV